MNTTSNYFGQECVIQLEKNDSTTASSVVPNPRFARGTFGEISIALFRQQQQQQDRDHDTKATETSTDSIQQQTNTNVLQFVAIKTITQPPPSTQLMSNSENDAALSSLCGEVEILRNVQSHPNITSLLAVYPGKSSHLEIIIHIVTEYCPIDLYMSLEWRRRQSSRQQQQLSLSTIQCILYDVLNAVQYLHTTRNNGFIHNDIKPGNILISTGGYIKLCDFGLAQPITPLSIATTTTTEVASDTTTTTMVNGHRSRRRRTGMTTLNYRAPEVILGNETYAPSMDMYAIGVVFAELLLAPMATTLFHGTTELEQFQQICAMLGTPTTTHWSDYKSLPYGQHFTFQKIYPVRDVTEFIPRCNDIYMTDATNLLRNIMVLDPKSRCTSTQAFQHVWFQNMKHDMERQRRLLLQEELIPPELIEPIIFHSKTTADHPITSGSTSTMETDLLPLLLVRQQALELAAKRRTFLSDLDQWER